MSDEVKVYGESPNRIKYFSPWFKKQLEELARGEVEILNPHAYSSLFYTTDENGDLSGIAVVKEKELLLVSVNDERIRQGLEKKVLEYYKN